MKKIDWNERIENDVKMYLDFSEHIIDYDFEWNNGKTNYDGWRGLYLDYIACSNDEVLLESFGTTDKELIYDTINNNIDTFNRIVKAKYQEVGEQYNKSNSDMTIREFWEQNAEIDDYGADDKKVLNNPLHYYFLDFDDIPKDKVKELIYHTNNNCELECVMTDDDGDISVGNSCGFFEWYDDDYTMEELFDDIYEHCSLYVNENN